MPKKIFSAQAAVFLIIAAFGLNSAVKSEDKLRLLFLHHSCGQNWLDDGLREAMARSGLEVHDATYGDAIGEDTDVCHWYPKFRDNLKLIFTFDAHPDTYYTDSQENTIIMFKSCFPNSDIVSSGDPNNASPEDCEKTTASYKASYHALTEIFAKHPDKLFIIVTAPPLVASETNRENAKRAMQFNRWLAFDYLKSYYATHTLRNVYVFDFFGILSNENGFLKSGYETARNDSHPNKKANAKATEAFIPFLQKAIQEWKTN